MTLRRSGLSQDWKLTSAGGWRASARWNDAAPLAGHTQFKAALASVTRQSLAIEFRAGSYRMQAMAGRSWRPATTARPDGPI
jgi:hypothetical protein